MIHRCIKTALCINMLLIHACVAHKTKTNCIQGKIVNRTNGTFITYDCNGNTITMNWITCIGKDQALSEYIRSVANILVPAYTQVELAFAKKHPEAIAQDFMLKSLSPLFEQGVANVDWQLVEHKITEILQQFFTTMDWTKHVSEQDIHYFVEAIDQKTGKRLGVIQFFRTPEFAPDNFKVALYGVLPTEQERGIEKLLMDSVVQLVPTVKRIFMHTRANNEKAIQQYSSWGFTRFSGSAPYWVDMEYIVK